MDAKICAQCANEDLRAGCRVCFKKGKTMKHCLNFYPKMWTEQFLKWLKKGKLRPESIVEAKKLAEQELAKT